MEGIYAALAGTPWWVYALFIYLVVIGIKSSKRSVVSLYRLAFMPILFTALSIHTLVTYVDLNITNILILVISIILGALVGWMQISRLNLQVDKEKKLIQAPGTWTVLILILIIFATKYYFGYELAINPEAGRKLSFAISLLFITGLCTGLFVGRFLCYLNRLMTLPHTNLNPD